MGKANTLVVRSKITSEGIDIHVLGKKYPIVYPRDVWRKTPARVKKALQETLVLADTHVLPLVLHKTKIEYDFPTPVFEPFLFKNQLFDLLDCEAGDAVPHLTYIRKFYNLEYAFQGRDGTLPRPVDIPRERSRQATAIVPFTFGKESLATFALCQELGIDPVLVYSQEPSQPYEEAYKLKQLKKIVASYHVKTYFLKHGPGLFRYGKAFHTKKSTEIGWGTQTTLIGLLMIPFAILHRAQYVLFGSEYSNKEFEMKQEWKRYFSYDQTATNTALQNNMVRLMTHDLIEVATTFEPLEEVNIFYLLHHRYPELGTYQFSCSAEVPLAQGSQWCHTCYKCARMFVFARATGIDPFSIGFKKDLLTHRGLFDHYFSRRYATGSQQELDFVFYLLYRKKLLGSYHNLFVKNKLKHMKSWPWYVEHFSTLHPAEHVPPPYRTQMLGIFKEELKAFRKAITR